MTMYLSGEFYLNVPFDVDVLMDPLCGKPPVPDMDVVLLNPLLPGVGGGREALSR